MRNLIILPIFILMSHCVYSQRSNLDLSIGVNSSFLLDVNAESSIYASIATEPFVTIGFGYGVDLDYVYHLNNNYYLNSGLSFLKSRTISEFGGGRWSDGTEGSLAFRSDLYSLGIKLGLQKYFSSFSMQGGLGLYRILNDQQSLYTDDFLLMGTGMEAENNHLMDIYFGVKEKVKQTKLEIGLMLTYSITSIEIADLNDQGKKLSVGCVMTYRIK